MGNNRKNILLIIPELCVGGAQRSLVNLSIELAKKYTVTLVVFSKAQLAPYSLGGELLSLEVYPGASWLSKVWAFGQRVFRLRRIKNRLKIDASISFLEGADYVNILSKKRDRVIISIRGSKFHDEAISGKVGWLRMKILMPFLYRLADCVVCVSDGLRREMIEKLGIGSSNVSTIYNFLTDEQLEVEGKGKPITDINFPFLLAVGRLHIQKNFMGLLKVFSLLRKQLPELRLIVLGDGPERNALLKFSTENNLVVQEQLNLQGDIYFLGFQNPKTFFQRAKLFLLTSSWEGFPNVLIEALKAGTPVISTDCETGPREILMDHPSEGALTYPCQTDYGILMPKILSDENEQLWAKTIADMIADSEMLERYRSVGPDRAIYFSATKAIGQWVNQIEGTDIHE